MSIAMILVGTAMLWLVGSYVIMPLTKYLIKNQIDGQVILGHGAGVAPSVASQAQVDEIRRFCFVLASVVVLAIIGFVLGMVAKRMFFGVSLTKWGWPGMASMMFFSLIGSLFG